MINRHIMLLLMGLAMLVITGCQDNTIDENLATLNAAATKAANGTTNGGGSGSTPVEDATPAPTDSPNLFDLTTDPNGLLVQAWGRVNGLPSGSEFTIKATQGQAGAFMIETLKLNGWENSVQGGSAVVDTGQIRLDLALVDTNGSFGAGTVSFQPTLDSLGRVQLNPLGGNFAGLKLPDGLTGAFGDAVHSALTGAPNDRLSSVTLSLIELEDGVMRVVGVRR